MGSDERVKLKILLDHWVKHNREHSREFSEWAEKAREMGEAGVGEDILQAAQEMDKAGEFLSQARRSLGEE